MEELYVSHAIGKLALLEKKQTMQIINERPPKWVWDECRKSFKIDEENIVFSFGNIIYNPRCIDIPDHLMVHEEVHGVQQNHNDADAAVWWKRYLEDPKFRIEQEVEAYAAQYRFICEKVKDKNARYRNLHMLAQDLSGPIYGEAIAYTDAMRRIRNGS